VARGTQIPGTRNDRLGQRIPWALVSFCRTISELESEMKVDWQVFQNYSSKIRIHKPSVIELMIAWEGK
jgi:hypothetical protein